MQATTNPTINIALLGISGRMGRALLSGVQESADLKLSGALVSANSHWRGQNIAAMTGSVSLSKSLENIVITDDPNAAIDGAQVAIDFTLPQATPAIIDAAIAKGCALVMGTTGHSPEQRQIIEHAAKKIPIVMAANMSLGVNLLLKLAELAATALDNDYDIEIFEAHHRNKKDAPSGTALAIGNVVAHARGTTLQADGDFARHGETGIRRKGAIGFSVLRGGDIVGDHTLTFAGPGERIELIHRAHDRMGFARGALRAGRWLLGKPAGIYSMQDVLGLNNQ